jgi:hypothetical protein
VEEKLLSASFTTAIINCFRSSKKKSFESVLEPLQKLLRLSPPVAHAVGKPEFFARILRELSHNKAVVRLNLLRILRTICDASEQKELLIRQYGMYQTIQRLAEKDGAVLVRNLAGEMIKLCAEKDKKRSHRQSSGRRLSSASSLSSLPSISSASTPSLHRRSSDLLTLWNYEHEATDQNAEGGVSLGSNGSTGSGTPEKKKISRRPSSGLRTSSKYIPRRSRPVNSELRGFD